MLKLHFKPSASTWYSLGKTLDLHNMNWSNNIDMQMTTALLYPIFDKKLKHSLSKFSQLI